MKILAIESSCDETAVAVVEDGRKILADCIASQAETHAIYGGVVPEIASRRHTEVIASLTEQAMTQAGVTKEELTAIAVCNTPGLIGALLVGVSFAKSLAYAWGKPLVPVHHLRGHIAAAYLAFPELEPPFTALCISGGNTCIVDVRSYTDMEILGATRDDAAGESFDKVGRVLGLPYPGGAAMDAVGRQGDDGAYVLPRAVIAGHPYDMSFSGLKTASLNLIHNAQQKGEAVDVPGLCASFGRAVSETLVPRTLACAKVLNYGKIVVAGGVAANARIRTDFEKACAESGDRLFVPPLFLCGDNGAMIGAQGYYELSAGVGADLSLNGYATSDLDAPKR